MELVVTRRFFREAVNQLYLDDTSRIGSALHEKIAATNHATVSSKFPLAPDLRDPDILEPVSEHPGVGPVLTVDPFSAETGSEVAMESFARRAVDAANTGGTKVRTEIKIVDFVWSVGCECTNKCFFGGVSDY